MSPVFFGVAMASVLMVTCSGCQRTESQVPSSSDSSEQKIDVDITSLSTTMAYAEMCHVLGNQDAYMGKRLKVNGQYARQYFEDTDEYYHFILVSDDTLCCQAPLEFAWSGEHEFPEDYPNEQQDIVICGVLEKYEELGQEYIRLVVEEDNLIVVEDEA